MTLILKPAPIISTRDSKIRAHYDTVKRKWYAKLGKEQHPIAQQSLEVAGAPILYSLPENDKHPAWTKRSVTKMESPFEISKWWSVLREGIAIYGKPNVKEGTFIITAIAHDDIKETKE